MKTVLEQELDNRYLDDFKSIQAADILILNLGTVHPKLGNQKNKLLAFTKINHVS